MHYSVPMTYVNEKHSVVVFNIGLPCYLLYFRMYILPHLSFSCYLFQLLETLTKLVNRMNRYVIQR